MTNDHLWIPAQFLVEITSGRRFLAHLPEGTDLNAAIHALCKAVAVDRAAFHAAGTARSCTIGTFDPEQQVYVVHSDRTPREILSCTGTYSRIDGNPAIFAHIVLADGQGIVTGGRLFSETLLDAAEIDLLEINHPTLERRYDETTGRLFWRLPGLSHAPKPMENR